MVDGGEGIGKDTSTMNDKKMMYITEKEISNESYNRWKTSDNYKAI